MRGAWGPPLPHGLANVGMYGGTVPSYGAANADPVSGQTSVTTASPQVQPGTRAPTFVPGKVFLGGLGNDITAQHIRDYAQLWGAIRDLHVMDGKGYAFITFENVSEAQEFLGQHEHDINGKKVEAKAAVPKDQGGNRLTKKLFAGGIGDVSDETFSNYFARYGNIVNAVVLRKQDGTSKNYGFVTFDNEMSVEKCLVESHMLNGRSIEVRRANPKDGGGSFDGHHRDRPTGGQMNSAGRMGLQGGDPQGALLAMAGGMPPGSMMGMPMPAGMFGMVPGMGFAGAPGMMPMMGAPGMMMPAAGAQGMMPNPMLMGMAGFAGMPMMAPGAGMPLQQMGGQQSGLMGGRSSAQGNTRPSLGAGMGGSRGGYGRSQGQGSQRSSQGGNQRFRPY